MSSRHQELEDRLVRFAATIIELVNGLPNSKAGAHLGGQLIRSGTAPALNYGEARSAESRKDFVHKMQIALKELRESHANLRIIEISKLHSSPATVASALDEVNQLIAIFVSSIKTARVNN